MKKLFFVFLTLILTSCASSEYSCSEFSIGGCTSISEVYKESGKEGYGAKKKKNNVQFKKEANSLKNSNEEGVLLSAPKVIRIYMNKWEDQDGDLHIGGHIYLKIEGSVWKI